MSRLTIAVHLCMHVWWIMLRVLQRISYDLDSSLWWMRVHVLCMLFFI
jgi:membrane protein required for beta-lactamase induction